MKYLYACFVCLLCTSGYAQQLADDCLQLIVVRAAGWSSVSASLQRYERHHSGAAWKKVGREFRVALGKNGIAWDESQTFRPQERHVPFKREGDGKSPAGLFPLLYAYGYDAPRQKWQFPYVQVDERTFCIDDAQSRYYNQVVSTDTIARPDWKSREEMRRPDELYRFGIVVGYNTHPVRAGKGSCIFMHLSAGTPQRPKGTAGCTAMQRVEILEILDWLQAAKQPMLLQLPASEWQTVRKILQLPES